MVVIRPTSSCFVIPVALAANGTNIWYCADICDFSFLTGKGVGGSVANESALGSAVRGPPPAPWPDGGPESLRSPRCGLAIHKNQKNVLTGSPGYILNNKKTLLLRTFLKK
ncbi:hypothetical protein PoB_000904200 [Plakobranchus ocellatus]|uniref:Secreted protein n=1 Tax=Plakobranchus ocellatus TaxID=259542 RepID=A0AAV3YK06_9GAST|nr:hypothetical protein PoB_000904200 [Plakobranchus ocellatus]